jgi:hypothetical protein
MDKLRSENAFMIHTLWLKIIVDVVYKEKLEN